MYQRLRLSPRDWLGVEGRDAGGEDAGAGCEGDTTGGGDWEGAGLLGRIVGATFAGGEKLLCGGRYSGELKRRSDCCG